jgi:Uma2 family endonuclease
MSARLVTAEELERFPSDDNRYELVAGHLVPMTPVSFAHGRTVIQFGSLLHEYIRKRKLGVVVTEVGFILATDPDTVRAPDLAFLRQERIPTPDPHGFCPGAPDLAVEVLSPDDRLGEIRSKVDEYFAMGVPAVLVIDPDLRSVEVHRPSSTPVRLADTDTLDLDDVLPAFRCAITEIFE